MLKKTITLILYLHKLGLSLSHLEFLRCMDEHVDLLPGKHKIINDLVRLGYAYNWEITDKGLDLLKETDNWDNEDVVYTPKKEEVYVYSPDFVEFWSLFPSIDSFEYGGKEFTGIRNLRTKKKECAVLYEKLSEEYPPGTIKRCLTYEVEARKDMSVVRGANQLSFMSNSHTWLLNKKFEPYINLSNKGPYKSKSGQIKRIINQI